MSLALILVAILIMAASGLSGLFISRRSEWGQWIAAAMTLPAAAAGLVGSALAFTRRGTGPWELPLSIMGARPVLGVDSLSALFLVPVFLMGVLGALYGLGYWAQSRHLRSGRKLRCFWGLLVAGMGLLIVSRHAIVFLLGWEMMALSAFFLVSTEDHRPRCRQAGWVYIVATHVGTLTLFALFALWRHSTGSYDLVPAGPGAMSPGVRTAVFFLAIFGFGLKAGAMPLHFWLPSAHANAPTHVSAILSGVVLKVGVYGLVRMLSLLPDPPATWGAIILFMAAVSALLGVAFAIAQHDLKRLLAYHSVENIGIILMGLGLAMLGRSLHRTDWVVLGMAGCLLHVWNHSFFKSLLFFCAGSVLHGAHTLQTDRLGGLAKAMPQTALLFLVGAVAICGLPPLNGFVSELLVYLGLLRGLTTPTGAGSAAAMAAPVLAMVGALALACFVKVYGAVFLGQARSAQAARAHEAPLSMRAPAMILAAVCLAIGLAPSLVAPLLDAGIADWMPAGSPPATPLGDLLPLRALSAAAVGLLAAIVLASALLSRRRRAALGPIGTWDCGYARPTARMQYTASSFAHSIVSLFRRVLRPRTAGPVVHGAFPATTTMHTHVDEPVLDGLLLPGGRALGERLRWFHRFQQGLTQHYVLYILIAVMALLATLVPYEAILRRLLAL